MSREPPLCRHPSGRLKKSYRSLAKARRAAVATMGRDYRLHPYRCPQCRMWHLTSREQQTTTSVRLIDGYTVIIDKPPDVVERDIETARAGDYTHTRWNSYRKTVPLHRIRGVVRDEETAA